jgi:prophage maintenance system killer protein
LKRPTLALVVAINRAVRADDEWFDEPDDLPRVEAALRAIDGVEDPVVAAGVMAARISRSQAFGEGNKRTALLVARWILDRNGLDGAAVIRADDFELADLLVQAAAGRNVEEDVVALFQRCS